MDDLKKIKKLYGEKMAQLCRELFPTILETPGELEKIMVQTFNPSKYLYYDIVKYNLLGSFKEFIYSKLNKKEETLVETEKDPFELMEEAGYILTECTTEEQIQSFKKYYKSDEALCTFGGGRLKDCYVFFAVKKDVDKIKREDFNKPRREDEYGTSVISIQFSRYNGTVSIKNRYNHKVHNPDATFGNNLENIIPGLTRSFEKTYGYKVKQSKNKFEIAGYVEARGKFYKYNIEINNIYYCPNNIIIKNGKVEPYPPEQYIIMDYYVLDLKSKTLRLLDDRVIDGFVEEYKDIKDIEIKKEDNQKKIIITTQDGKESIITINNQNQIIGYENNNIEIAKKRFMKYNRTLNKLKMKNLTEMEDECFYWNNDLKEIILPKLQTIGEWCFVCNTDLNKLSLPELKKISSYCFYWNMNMKALSLPKLVSMGKECFHNNQRLDDLVLPNLISMGFKCFQGNTHLLTLILPKLKEMGEGCFYSNSELRELSLPNLEIMHNHCFLSNRNIKELSLPKLKKMGLSCFYWNEIINEVYAPNLENIDECCFEYAPLKEVTMPKLTKCGSEKIQKFIEQTEMTNSITVMK